MKIINRINTTTIAEIHIGDNTHPHDQLIFPRSLRVIKTICKSPINPIPPPLDPLLI
jgi:hypothetical protein